MALSYEQRVARREGLGGSDIAAILGLSRYASPLDIYNDKVGELSEDIGNEATNRGNLLEPIILEWYDMQSAPANEPIKTGLETFIHPQYPFLRANIDGLHHNTIIEAKSVHMWSKAAKEFGEECTDQIPTEYLVQCAFYNEVVPETTATYIVTAFVKDNSGTKESIDRYAIYLYNRNEKLGQGIIQKAVHFWENHVVPRIPPAGESLRKGTPSVDAKIADPEMDSLVKQLNATAQAQKGFVAWQKDIIQKIQEHMEEYELLKDESGKELASWKFQISNRFDLKAFEAEHPDLYKQYLKQSSSRVFRLKGAND